MLKNIVALKSRLGITHPANLCISLNSTDKAGYLFAADSIVCLHSLIHSEPRNSCIE